MRLISIGMLGTKNRKVESESEERGSRKPTAPPIQFLESPRIFRASLAHQADKRKAFEPQSHASYISFKLSAVMSHLKPFFPYPLVDLTNI